MLISANTLQVNKTAHYYNIGEPGRHIKRLLVALHGYGQAAGRFAHRFDDLAGRSDTLVICPEGLSRFYWGGFTGEVVASWMTKQDRLADIQDNMAYLNQLYDSIRPLLHPDVRTTLLGFSQGCPTLSRWAIQHPDFQHLILWGGQLAHDADFASAKSFLSDKELLFVYGTADRFLKFGYPERQRELAEAAGLPFREITFDGKHEIPRDIFMEIWDGLNW